MQLQNVKVSRDESAWEVEIQAEIPADVLSRYRTDALKEMQRDAKLDGFRPGHAPIERIVQLYGEEAVMRSATQHAIQHELPDLMAAEKLLVIGSPKVTVDDPIRQLADGKPLKFTARAALTPRVELPDYKKIAAKINANKEEVSVSDKEHDEAMVHLKRERHRIDKMEAGVEAQKAAEESRNAKPEELPALDDTFVKTLGYENAEKFSEALRANIKNEKELQAAEKRRAAILDELVKESAIKYPATLREFELDDMEARLKADLERMGTNFDAYLAEAKKTKEQLRTEWKEPADKRAKVRLILSEIAHKENIAPDKAVLEKEIAHAKEHYPQAEESVLRVHITHALKNDATLKFLEKITD